ncbi:Periplasmic component of the Tol biopolymer transport system [Gilliamella apis SCGC AB-598-P17]|nr:Periplasmic component of the Tol biopolymer transport system [Gilliamella apis SCGC AB-598-P17]
MVKNNKGPYTHELRVSDYDGYDQITVHRSKEPLMSPTWSPDGKKLAYVTFESGRSALVLKTLDSGAVETIASFPQHNGAPAFSPDGSKLAFALSKGGSLNLYMMNLSSKKITQITSGRSNDTEPPDVRPGLANLRAPPLLFGRRPPQSNYPPDSVPYLDSEV